MGEIMKNLERHVSLLWEVMRCDMLKKNVTGTLFGTVGVVEWSYRKFGEFVVKWMGKLANENKV